MTGTGRKQARELGQRLTAFHFDEIYSSTAVRAKDTALIACSQAGFSLDDLVFSDDLLELSQGEWEGKSRPLIYTEKTLAKMKADPWKFRAPGGESQKEVEERMYDWLGQTFLQREQGYENLSAAIFTHGLAIKCLLRKILDFSPNMTWKIKTHNTSITMIRYGEKGWSIGCINDAKHLEDHPI